MDKELNDLVYHLEDFDDEAKIKNPKVFNRRD